MNFMKTSNREEQIFPLTLQRNAILELPMTLNLA